jgi:hypothetical protein
MLLPEVNCLALLLTTGVGPRSPPLFGEHFVLRLLHSSLRRTLDGVNAIVDKAQLGRNLDIHRQRYGHNSKQNASKPTIHLVHLVFTVFDDRPRLESG